MLAVSPKPMRGMDGTQKKTNLATAINIFQFDECAYDFQKLDFKNFFLGRRIFACVNWERKVVFFYPRKFLMGIFNLLKIKRQKYG